MKKLISSLDCKIMFALEWATSTKGAFYFLVLLIVVANIIKPPSDLQAWLLVIVSEFYQGVALPGLGSAQRAEAEETRRLLQETHDMVLTELKEIKETHAQETEEIIELKEILQLLKSQKEG
jgi:hypothetical protein